MRRRLARAGYTSVTAVLVYTGATIATPFILAARGHFASWRRPRAGSSRLSSAAIGYLLPGLVLGRLTERRKREIREGLPDALDLFIVCVEAGCGLDQAIVKASDELGLTYPALAYELRLITTEIRAGKSRMEAFKNFAARTLVDDVQSLVVAAGADRQVRDEHRAGAADARRNVPDQAPPECRRAGRKNRRQAGVPSGPLPVSQRSTSSFSDPAVISFVRVFGDVAN